MQANREGYDPYNKSIKPDVRPVETLNMDEKQNYLDELKKEQERLELLRRLEEEERERLNKNLKK